MASITLSAGYIAATGRDIILSGSSATVPTSLDVMDWLAGYTAGKGFSLASGKAIEFHTAVSWVDSTTGQWRVKVHLGIVNEADRCLWGEPGEFLTVDAGALSDSFGNALAAASVPLPNYSLMGSDGFLSSTMKAAAGTHIYVAPVAGVGSDTRTLAQSANIATPVQTLGRAYDLAATATGQVVIHVLEGTTHSFGQTNLPSGPGRLTPHIITTYWNNYGSGIGAQGERPHLTITAQMNIKRSNIAYEGIEFGGSEGLSMFFFGFDQPTSDITFVDCDLLSCYRQVVLSSDLAAGNVNTRPTFHRTIFGPTGGGGIAIYALQCVDLLCSECVTDRAGENGDGTGDSRVHAIYIQWKNDPAFFVRHFARRSGSHAIQLRPGGGISWMLSDECPILMEMCGPGGFMRNVWNQRSGPIVNASNGGSRGWGATSKYSDSGTDPNITDNPLVQHSWMVELYVHTQPESGQGDQPKAIGYTIEGPAARRDYRSRNIQSRRGGSIWTGLRAGFQFSMPRSVSGTHNLMDSRGAVNTPSYGVESDNVVGTIPYSLSNNRYAGDSTSTHTINGSSMTLAAFQSATGQESGSAHLSGGSAPTYTSDLCFIKDWFATIAGGSNDHQAAYEFFTLRGRGVWETEHDVKHAILWLREKQAPTNIADIGTGPLAFVGAGPSTGAFDGPQYGGTVEPPTVPPVPTVSATAGDGVVLFSISAAANLTARQLRWGTASGAVNLTNVVDLTTTQTQYLLTGRTNGTTIYAQVQDSNTAGDSGWSTEVSATPANTSPIANAGPDQNITDTDRSGDESVTFNFSGSSDTSPGTIATYILKEGSTTVSSGASSGPSITVSLGVHVYNLTVVDNDGATSTADSVTITITPNAVAGFSVVAGVGSLAYSCTAYTGIGQYEWQTGATPATYGPSVFTSVPHLDVATSTPRYARVRAVAAGVAGAWSSDLQGTPLPPVNSAPVANAGVDQVVTDDDNTGDHLITLDGSASSDTPPGTIVSQAWSEGATSLGTNLIQTHTFPLGNHICSLVVTDDGALDSIPDTVSITVIPGKPVNFTVTPGVGSLDFACDAVTGITSLLWEWERDAFGVFQKSRVTPTFETTVTGLTPGVPVDARVTMFAGALSGAPSDIETGTPTSQTNPSIRWHMVDIFLDDYDVVTQPSITVPVALTVGVVATIFYWSVRNDGDTPIAIDSIGIEGIGFGVDAFDAFILQPQSTVTFGVYIQAMFVGTHTGTLRINTSTSPLANVAVVIEFDGAPGATQVPPSTPTNLHMIPGNGRVTALANVMSRATLYTFYLSTNSGTLSTSVYDQKINSNSPAIESSGWANDTEVFCIVTATGTGGTSAASSQASTTPIGDAPNPSKPTFITARIWNQTIAYLRQSNIWGRWLTRP